MSGKLTKAGVEALLTETDQLTKNFGDATLHRRNAEFDRHFTLSERKAEQRVIVAVAAVVLLIVLSVALASHAPHPITMSAHGAALGRTAIKQGTGE